MDRAPLEIDPNIINSFINHLHHMELIECDFCSGKLFTNSSDKYSVVHSHESNVLHLRVHRDQPAFLLSINSKNPQPHSVVDFYNGGERGVVNPQFAELYERELTVISLALITRP